MILSLISGLKQNTFKAQGFDLYLLFLLGASWHERKLGEGKGTTRGLVSVGERQDKSLGQSLHLRGLSGL